MKVLSFFSKTNPFFVYMPNISSLTFSALPKFKVCFFNILAVTNSSKTDVSSPMAINFSPDPIIFSTKVDPHLGTPIMKIGFIFFDSLLTNPSTFASSDI